MLTAMEDKTTTSGFSINRLGNKFCIGNCRSLKMLLRVFILSNLFSVVWGCDHNEIGWRDGATGNISCSQCTPCPPGTEPTVACGTTVDKGTVHECKQCVAGKTYSESDSVGFCEACTVCSSTVAVLKQCTTDSNTKCGSCPKGHYKDDFIEDCFKCSWCCEGDNDYVPECAEQGLPSKKRCKDLRNDCGSTTRYTSNTTADVSNITTNTRDVTSEISTDVDSHTISGEITRKNKDSKLDPDWLLPVGLFLLTLVLLVLIIIVIVIARQRGVVALVRSRGWSHCLGWCNKVPFGIQVSARSHKDTDTPKQANHTSSGDLEKQDPGLVETRL